MKRLTHPSQLAGWKVRLLEERPAVRKTVVVSSGTCGQASGSVRIAEAFRREIDRRGLSDEVRLETTGCHGFCELEPNVVIYPRGVFYRNLGPEDVPAIVGETLVGDRVIPSLVFEDPATGARTELQTDIPYYGKQLRLLTENNLHLDPTRIEDYILLDGYQALGKVLFDMTSEEVIREITASGLRGRGGAGFPTGRKWQLCRDSAADRRYIICNADEGNPGTFMDRSILGANPHSVIEGMIIGAYAMGAAEGYVYVRMEAPNALRMVTLARDAARKCGLLGRSILGSEFHFDIQVVEGAGAFVCGEETSLMASIEGRRASPRQRPPFPAQSGLWGKPTNINNVETWANVPLIISRGAAWYSGIGTEKSKGTKIFSLVGKIRQAGNIEVPMGISLREIVYDIGGGIKDGKRFKAIQTGGPSGGCLPAAMLDLTIDYDNLVQAGSTMGSGGMIVMDETTCMVDIARHYLHFTQEESCGKCVPCRVGTRQMHDILVRITEGRGEEKDLERLESLGQAIMAASLCGLGQAAPKPVLSTLRHFKDEYLEHIRNKKCPSLVCKEIVSAPCQYACPIGQEAPVYIALAAQNRLQEALDVIYKDNPLPFVCGRVCDHPCETVCEAGKTARPIAVRGIKRSVLDWARREGRRPSLPGPTLRDEAVAVVGAGPAGLTAAYFLAVNGFAVTVFEAAEAPGGTLRALVPDFRLPKEVLELDIEHIREAGVTIETKAALGRDFSLDDLFQRGFKAVLIAVGARKPRRNKLPGENAQGVLGAAEFLGSSKSGTRTALGKRVGVVGGGWLALDAARAAVRTPGCEKVTLFFGGQEQHLGADRADIESAAGEGVEFCYLCAPVSILAEKDKVKGLECRKLELGAADENGRRALKPVPRSGFRVELEAVIMAAGGGSGFLSAAKKEGLETTGSGDLAVDGLTPATNRPGVFGGGEAAAGPLTIVQAMAWGRRAAESIARYVEGDPSRPEAKPVRPSVYVREYDRSSGPRALEDRPDMPRLPEAKRKKNHREVETGLSDDTATREARRCLRCELRTKEGIEALRENDD
jgi:NADH-quinone oxidoreductase subunit F